ncbi:uncharacterized protein DNG_09895 [Cephalotrichum gorgonifer]|uniref:Zn(2)-C6 fungal-type domain-containing protein n=1 Tax=Cephalotrichum gorgonifer TaxID=2041049 RepID=A0AAE8SZQ6_9PEZI|nr:uncharacterized protein DNG_09895 [Cephalotrichum gorgonifer]
MAKGKKELPAESSPSPPTPGGTNASNNPRKKKWATKVKTGCTTCRIRRVKCDETRPACTRCVSTGRRCDGYTSLPALVRQPDHSASPFRSSWDERRMFFFFRTETALQVAGPFDQSFWTVDLLKATQVHPAIWHASVAVAAMYKRYTIPSSAHSTTLRKDLYNFALTQYNASISGLVDVASRENPGPGDKDVILATSILYTGLCSLRGDPREAFLHMRNGLKLFRQWKHWERRRSRGSGGVLPVNSIVTLFNRLDSQALNLLDDASRMEWEGGHIPREPSTKPFTSVTEAYFEFELSLSGLLGLMQRREFIAGPYPTGPSRESRLVFRNALSAWSEKFSALRPLLKESEMEAALILQIRHIAFDIALTIDVSSWELAWDEFHPQYEQIVTFSRQLLEKYHPATGGDGGAEHEACGPIFSFAASVCEPLYVAASSCRDPVLRREAISLLRQWPRRECLWDSVLAASLAESIMLMEEQAADGVGVESNEECLCVREQFVCHGHRVADTKLELLGEGVGMVTLRSVNDILAERPGRTIQLSW